MKIEFFSTIDGLAEAVPIIPAKDYKPNWMKRAREDYKRKIETAEGRMDHIYQCPGIFDLTKVGYIIPMWHDVLIETTGTGDFKWTVPTTDVMDLSEGKDIISRQVTGVETLMPVRPWTSGALLKINTPWHVVAPKGVKFLMIPIAYPDSFELESSTGILDPGVSSEINIQAYCNIPRGKFQLKAGQPLAQLIPLSERQFDLDVRNANEKDLKWIKKSKFLMNYTFKQQRNIVKEIYYKYFGTKK
jgi:hypothetical protein